MQRAAFIGPDALQAQDGEEPHYAGQIIHGSSVSQQICELQQAYNLPSRAVQMALFENFFTYCYPWDPTIERSQIIGVPTEGVSRLLLQAIFLGGSRVSSAPLSDVTPHDFYLRAKTLFWTNQESNPLVKIIAVSLLHWWNPHGPELVSSDTSTFWNSIAVNLAVQMGLNSAKRRVPDEALRRKLWWSIVARDCLISAAHGRAQAVDLSHCDVPRPTIRDFPHSSTTGPVFIAYVDLAAITGRFVKHSIRKLDTADTSQHLRQWVEALPPSLRLSSLEITQQHGSINSFNVRQLNVIYYTAVAMVFRARTSDGPFPTAAVLAGSAIASLFEELLARDQIRFLNPVYTFYLLVASIALLSCYRYESMWQTAQEDLKIISLAQEEMKKKWPSAIGSIRSYQKMYSTATKVQTREQHLPEQVLDKTQAALLGDIQASPCRMWNIIRPILESETKISAGNVPINETQPTARSAVYPTLAGGQQDHSLSSGAQIDEPMGGPDWNTFLSDAPLDEWQIDEDLFGGHLFWDELPSG
ncbi:uncharacterized protein LTR77_009947 [Saxophila tyrrhenica]|uniref:Xylanolytic transcriptional activator regulatory domain-containing protein n=1 Tax=Saxophila tyrrhenica TaxID=1690608 RepID=A0AAV9P0F6_9PEZI|nr:hypothetical protein LTR77_009947 [Saxophila tyrrhenica]